MFEQKREQVPDLVQSLKIAAPCPVSWESMDGDERVRHCSNCNKNVYNISDMTAAEANQFLQLTGQKACVNFYKRADGTVIVDNCPVGLRKLRAQYRRMVAAGATILSLVQGLFLITFAGDSGKDKSGNPACSKDTAINPSATPLRGEPVAPSIRGKFAPVLIGGSPTPLVKSAAVKEYEEGVKSRLMSSLPKHTELGRAAVSLGISTDGSVKTVNLISKSPSEKVDSLIVKAAQGLHLAPLPADFVKSNPLMKQLPVYLELR